MLLVTFVIKNNSTIDILIMKLYNIYLALFILITMILQSCDDYQDNGKYTYMPKEITIIDSVNIRLTSKFSYDEQNRIKTIIDIIDGGENDSTYTEINYDGQGYITSLSSNCFDRTTITSLKSVSKRFAYNNQDVSVTSTGNEQSIKTIGLNDRQQALKVILGGSDKYISYEYDDRGNYSRITDESDEQYLYNFDNRRGIFKHVNMPYWFLTNILNNPRGITSVSMNEYVNINNNCTTVFWIDLKNDSTNNRVTQTNNNLEYSAFGYPVAITESNIDFYMTIKYIRTN